MHVCVCVCVCVCGVRGHLVVVFRNKGCFLWLDVAAVGGAVHVCVCVCVRVCVCVCVCCACCSFSTISAGFLFETVFSQFSAA